MTTRRTVLIGLGAVLGGLALPGCQNADDAGKAAEKSGKVEVLRVGFTATETDADRIAQLDSYKAYLEEQMGLPVQIFRASDYLGVAQAMEAGQLDLASVGPSNYASLHLRMGDKVRPILMPGDASYYSALYVRADSPYKTVADLRGKTLAFADINSTSGYLIPNYYLRREGYSPDSFFGKTIFAGGHEQGVIAVLREQADAGVTWSSMEGDPATGYSRGIFHRMIGSDLLKMSDLRILWKGGPIPPGPMVARTSLPPDVVQKLVDLHKGLQTSRPDIFAMLVDGEANGFVEPTEETYADIIEMRRQEEASRSAR
jgi:phosphonate transport system substrate-binding protein